MKRSIKFWQLAGFIATSLGGTLLHFLYDWLNGAKWIAPFSGVNESTWEHMKLLFWPMIIFAIIQGIFFRDYESYWCIKLCGILLGLTLIPVLFYTYNGAIGRSPDWLNITFFFISAAIAYIYEARALTHGDVACKNSKRALIWIGVIGALFVIFTFRTPMLGIFEDPISGDYGINSVLYQQAIYFFVVL